MNHEDESYIRGLEDELRSEKMRGDQLANSHPNALFNAADNENLITWQLELDNILERIDHLLRGHSLKFDKAGNLNWEEPKDKSLVVFNEYGVQEILRILSMYLNRNTILSNYNEETINWKIFDIGQEITDLIYMKYEKMGLDNKDKIKLYPIIVRQLVDTIHSAYLRSLNGGERESLRTARTVTQTEPLNQQMPMNPMGGNSVKSFSFFKPSTWTGR